MVKNGVLEGSPISLRYDELDEETKKIFAWTRF